MSEPDWQVHENAESATEVALIVLEALAAAEIPAALGGSLALGVWGVPRGTQDVDLAAFVREDELDALLETLARAGCGPKPGATDWSPESRETFFRSAREGDVAIVYRGSMRVDVFVPSIPFHEEIERTLRHVTPPGRGPVPVISAEALCVLKLLFFRPKDIVDLERLVARQRERLDQDYVRRHMVEMVGEDDDRVETWDRIWSTYSREEEGGSSSAT